MDYFTCLVETILLKQLNNQVVMKFIKHHIITRFGVPMSLIFYNASYFLSMKLSKLTLDEGFILRHSSNNYP